MELLLALALFEFCRVIKGGVDLVVWTFVYRQERRDYPMITPHGWLRFVTGYMTDVRERQRLYGGWYH